MADPPTNPLWPPERPASRPAPAGRRCGECAWRYLPDGGSAGPRCHRHPAAPALDDDWPACPAFEANLSCTDCGACCGEAYHCVEVGRDEVFARLHGELLVERFGQLQLPRPGGRCVCLEGSPPALSCRLYADRPESCRDFPVGGRSCVEARCRVGRTP
ncbi:MAG: hypothetical protein D6798_07845 [Deltaproteobacteria bacterium]|nr:MAG: hypothetical protein D6798_07845 [Deltaproteobacteria bacterium]